MSIDLKDVLLFGGGGSFLDYGVLTKRTATWEEDAEHFSRAGEAPFIARDGTTQTASTDVMRVEWVSGDPTIRMGFASTASTYNNDRLYLDFEYPPQSMAFYIKWKYTALSTAGGDGILHVGSTVSTNGPHLSIYFASTGNLTFQHKSTGNTATSSPATVPSTGQTVEALLNLSTGGGVRGAISVNSGAVTKGAASTATVVLASTWAANKLWIGSLGAGNDADMRVYKFAVARSTQSMADMRTAE